MLAPWNSGLTSPSLTSGEYTPKALRERVSDLEADLTVLEEHMYEWHESAETYLRALRKVVEEKLGVSLHSYLQAGEGDVEEDVEESAQ